MLLRFPAVDAVCSIRARQVFRIEMFINDPLAQVST
jgi:hypothetical protein